MRTLREHIGHVIFDTRSRAGKAFDIGLLFAILASVVAVVLESVQSIHVVWGGWLYGIEIGFTALFTIEYGLRLWSTDNPKKYARSFFGVVDLASVLPTPTSRMR